MAKPTQEVCLLHSQSISANGTSQGVCIIPQDYWAAILYMVTGTPTGTSPTLDIYVQQAFTALISTDTVDGLMLTSSAIPSIFDDYLHFPQVTGTASTQKSVARILAEIGTSATNSPTANFTVANDAALAAGTIQPGPLGMAWRVKWVVGGTSPVFPTVSIIAQFLMPQG